MGNHCPNELGQILDWLGLNAKGFVDPDRAKSDFLQFKIMLKTFRGKSVQLVCRQLIDQFSDLFPDFCMMPKVLLTLSQTVNFRLFQIQRVCRRQF